MTTREQLDALNNLRTTLDLAMGLVDASIRAMTWSDVQVPAATVATVAAEDTEPRVKPGRRKGRKPGPKPGWKKRKGAKPGPKPGKVKGKRRAASK